MEKVYLLGQMAAGMRDNMLMIRNKALVYFYSKTEDAMKENGETANNMERVYFVRKMQQDMASGYKDNEFNGLMRPNRMKLDLFYDKNGLNSIYMIKF